MNKKNNVKKISALLLGVALAVGSTGCDNFILTDNEKDLAQTVATVNISGSLATPGNEYESVASEVGQIVANLSTDISKRDLVAYFLSTGYQYVENYGYSYADTFNMLMDGLVSREIMIQYAIAYYLKKDSTMNLASCNEYIEGELAKATAKEKELYAAHPEVLTLKYFLTENGADNEDYDRAVYNLKKSLNSSLDSLEASYIKEQTEDDEETVTPRTMPTGAATEKSDYYTNDYGVYTGRNTLDSCGEYEKVDGSTKSTRQKAYNKFLANLQGYNMISTSGKVEDTSDVMHLNYFYVELSSILGQSLINKYFEDMEDEIVQALDATYVGQKYDELKAEQQKKYERDSSSFSTAMGSVSDTSFLLYGLEGFGYVYNILLPFSTSQNVAYTTAKNNKELTQDDIYNERKKILNNVKGKDLRDTWYSEDEEETHAIQKEDGKWYFFQDQLAESVKYDKLKQYAGSYPFHGAEATKDGKKYLKATEITIDEFMVEFESHINKVVGSEVAKKDTTWTSTYAANDFETIYTVDDEVDYDKFIYYKGDVDLGEVSLDDYFVETSNVYKAVSAVNELMFAYSTDTGCLNTYYGYAVSPYKTDFVKEFEHAAQLAVAEGVGSYVVCATDYGWHIVFASYVYTQNGGVYGDYDHSQATGENKVEGSISNLFYESLKANAFSNFSNQKQSNVLNRYNNDASVTLFKDRYEDLLELE